MVTYYNVYYCVIVCWSLYYFIASFVSIPDLPWNTCGKVNNNSHNNISFVMWVFLISSTLKLHHDDMFDKTSVSYI